MCRFILLREKVTNDRSHIALNNIAFGLIEHRLRHKYLGRVSNIDYAMAWLHEAGMVDSYRTLRVGIHLILTYLCDWFSPFDLLEACALIGGFIFI